MRDAGKKQVKAIQQEATPRLRPAPAESGAENPETTAEPALFLQAVDAITAGAVERHMPHLPPLPPEE